MPDGIWLLLGLKGDDPGALYRKPPIFRLTKIENHVIISIDLIPTCRDQQGMKFDGDRHATNFLEEMKPSKLPDASIGVSGEGFIPFRVTTPQQA